MSQEQPPRPQDDEPVKIGGDVFSDAQEELAQKPAVPEDETALLGQTAKGGGAAAMKNDNAGLVSPDDESNIAEQDISITETDLPDRRIITEAVGGQVLSNTYLVIIRLIIISKLYKLPIIYISNCFIREPCRRQYIRCDLSYPTTS